MTRLITIYNLLLICMGLLFLPRSYADCSTSSSTTSFGSISSFAVASTAQTIESGTGFTCTGSLLSLLSTNTVNATITTSTNASGSTPQLYDSSTGTYLPYSICSDSSCSSTYSIGSIISWSSTTLIGLLGLFNSSDGTLPIYLRTSTGSNLPAGTYTDTITISWDYSICFVGALGVCVYTTGTATSTIYVTLIVTNYCYIDSAPDVDFGTAALPSGFSSVSSALSVRCTLDAAYSVNLSSSNEESDDWRQMSASVGGSSYYLQYQLARSSGTIWSSSSDYSDTGTGTSQSISYTATVNSSQNTVPAGSYSDTVTVTVTY
ncbi:Csu type fimbrial protein (plasmid) [Klebsiella sp. WOUb02]|uniref:Csu type fimbrial protein n=1 Tax=Klebsiella sp. WOUb02 TaxID=3161071 RepID=UPI003CF1D41B